MRPDPKAAFALGLMTILLLVGGGLAFAIYPDLFSTRVPWFVHFESVASLGEGAPVSASGIVIGRVARITWVPADRTYLTELRVDADVAVPVDGGVRIEEADPLRGATVTVVLGAACEQRRPSPPTMLQTVVATCRRAPGMLDMADTILLRVTDITGQIADLVAQLKASVAPDPTVPGPGVNPAPLSMAARMQDVADNVAALVKSTGSLVDALNRLQPDLQQTLASTRTLAVNTNELILKTTALEEGLRRDTLGRLNRTLEGADTLVRQNTPPLQQTLSDFRYMMGASAGSVVRLVTQLDTVTANLAEITRQFRDDPGMLLHGRSLENPPGAAGRSR